MTFVSTLFNASKCDMVAPVPHGTPRYYSRLTMHVYLYVHVNDTHMNDRFHALVDMDIQ